ncbi:leucine-rich PPR motif-containing protein, mitochondrial-like [Anneissia japonica]|uniref:leucine-rich PPR motif-containing protein, mitochondrial-like n=1 Tax=Anneissia japonica TaxID=1529436 RepID=UPI0014258049|nr:leucine-rich PPR motif-containing protein, mitochondrial-like [Anneissia japonica]
MLEKEERVMAYVIQCAHNDDNAVNKIEGLLELTKNSSFKEQSKIYFYLIKAFDEKQDWKGALNCRERMINEGIEVNDFNLKRIALLMKRNGQEPPFTEPEESLTYYREELKMKDKESPLEISAEQF